MPLILLVPVAAACGDDGDSVSSTEGLSPRAILARAADATVDASSARMTFVMAMRGLPGVGDVTIDGDGAMDFERHLAQIRMNIPDTGTGFQGEMEMRLDETVMYMRIPLPPEAADQLQGKTWLKVDLREAAASTGIDPTQQMWSDPRQTLAMLEGVSGSVTVVGEEDVRGVGTTHYHAEIDVRKAMESAGGIVDPEVFEEFASRFDFGVVPVDVWIDEANLVRRIRMEMKLPGTETTMLMTSDYYDFGADIDISPPPADDVMDMSEMMDQYLEQPR